MRQVLLNSSGAFVTRVPRPELERGAVLVRVQYSLISVGTEIASLLPPPPSDDSTVERVVAACSLARSYLGKAIRDPRKAVERVRLLVRQRLPRPIPLPPVVLSDELCWQTHAASQVSSRDGGLNFVTDASPFSYQCGTPEFGVLPGSAVIVEIAGRVDSGPIGVGLLAGEDGRWVASTTIGPGPVDDRLTFVVEGTRSVRLVFANVGAGAAVSAVLDKVAVSMAAPEALPHSEMDQQGWNVGYSLAGEVVAVGDGVEGLRHGDLVACAGAGKANHADYVCVKRNLVARLPSGCDPRWAATTTVGTIALQGVRRAGPQLGETIAVIGLGLIGQITAQLLCANGCVVVGLDLDQIRVDRAKSLGMVHGASAADDFKAMVRDITGGNGVDRVLVTAAAKSSAVVNLAMEISRQRGTVVLVGDVGLNIERSQFYRKEIDLLMSTSYGPGRYDREYEEEGRDYPSGHVRWTLNRNMQAYLGLLASGRLVVEPLIDLVAPVADARKVYDDLVKGGDQRSLGVLFRYDDAPAGADDTASVVVLRGHRKLRPDLINYVLVGAGAFGQSMLVPMMDKRPDCFHLKGVVSCDPVRGGNFARSRSVELLASGLEPVLEDPSVDMLVIATRHAEHADQVVRGLRAGKHVFVEKPLALSWVELDEIVAARRESAGLLMVGFNRRFSPAMQAMGRELEGRKSPMMAVYRLNGGYIPKESWIQGVEGGGRNLGEACHVYDCFRFLTGTSIKDIQVQAIDTAATAYLANDNFSAICTYEDGSVCTLIYTALGPKQGLPKERLEVFCDGKAWVLDDYKVLSLAGVDTPLWVSTETDKGHFEELSRLGDAIVEGREAPIPFDEIVETTAVALHVEDIIMGRL